MVALVSTPAISNKYKFFGDKMRMLDFVSTPADSENTSFSETNCEWQIFSQPHAASEIRACIEKQRIADFVSTPADR